ncbi:hypothetical protein [Paenibacillus sanguinis]|uniref:hypothetical protein n=1 Tax=Paenibacillus sanguinis TaxID=225906 RepID=UPI00035EF893|nr:hypothetical protein [Paenibacillus sanguinis]
MKPEMMAKPMIWNDETIKYKEILEGSHSRLKGLSEKSVRTEDLGSPDPMNS